MTYTGPITPNAGYFATASLVAYGLPSSNCYYSGCGAPGTYVTYWSVSTVVTINGNAFSLQALAAIRPTPAIKIHQ